jgi:cytochrome c oxidase cbb3-type subunit 4
MNIDLNVLRSIVTVAAFLAFVGILVWAYRPSQKTKFDEAAQLPFESEQEQSS